jgi:hypothetical protein
MRIPEYTAEEAKGAINRVSERLAVGKAPWIQDIGLIHQYIRQAMDIPTAYAYMDGTGDRDFQIEDPDGMDLVDALQRGPVLVRMRPS